MFLGGRNGEKLEKAIKNGKEAEKQDIGEAMVGK